MYMYGYFNDPKIQKISLGSIKYLTRQLNEFVSTYEKKVLIEDEEVKTKFERLKTIASLLNQQRFSELISDPMAVIDFNDDDEDYLPEWYPL